MTATYAGTILVSSVVCPPWCTVSQQDHLDDLHHLEGRAIHRSKGTTEDGRASEQVDAWGPVWWVDHACSTYVDGTPDGERRNVHLQTDGELSLDEAGAFARAILDVVQEARS